MSAPAKVARASHVWAREENDHYVEEPWVSRRLFEVETFEGGILDPACGFGNIVKSAMAAGLGVGGTDIVGRANFPILDFLAPTYLFSSPNIVTNPPFDIGEQFAIKALSLADRKVALVFPTRRLNAAGRWLAKTPLRRIWYLTPRPSMPPGHVYRELEAQGKSPSGGTMDFCWLVFERGYRGPVEARWLHRDGKCA